MNALYRLTLFRRVVNLLVRPPIRLGLGLRHTYLLHVPGRRSGKLYSTPVRLIENGERFLVAPYGERSWVRNARAAGWVVLSRGGRDECVRVVELDPGDRAPVLREYVQRVRVPRRFFEAAPDSPLDAFAVEAARHPVFRILYPGPPPE